MLSLLVHWVGSSGRIGNVLVNYRAVSPEDKSFAQGLTLMMLSLFAMIPGPIIFGRVIDTTCLVWNYQCGKRGDCQLYDQEVFRYSMNGLSLGKLRDVLWTFNIFKVLYVKNNTLYIRPIISHVGKYAKSSHPKR